MKINIKKSIRILCWVFAAIYLGLYIYRTAHWIYNPLANETFEWGSVNLMQCFLKGVNPYSLDNFLDNAYAYGPLYPYVLSWFYPLFNFIDPIVYCRYASLLFTIVTCIMVFMLVYGRTKDYLLSSLAFLASLTASWQTAPITAFPPAMAIMLCTYICLSLSYKWGHSVYNTMLLVFLSGCCFFIKPYFISITAIVVLVYLINKEWKSLVIYIIGGLLLLLLSFTFINNVAPACLYILISSHAGVANFSLEHLIKQFGLFLVMYMPLLFAISKSVIDKKQRIELIKNPFALWLIVSLFCLCYIGGHTGAFMEYFYHLLLIPFTIVGCYCLSSMGNKKDLLLPFLVFLSIYHINFISSLPDYRDKEIRQCVNKLDKLATKYDMGNSYCFCILIDDWACKHDMKYLNHGHREHVMHMKNKKVSQVKFFGDIHGKALQEMVKWNKSLVQNFGIDKPDLIFCDKRHEHFSHFINNGYIVSDTLDIPVGRRTMMQTLILTKHN